MITKAERHEIRRAILRMSEATLALVAAQNEYALAHKAMDEMIDKHVEVGDAEYAATPTSTYTAGGIAIEPPCGGVPRPRKEPPK